MNISNLIDNNIIGNNVIISTHTYKSFIKKFIYYITQKEVGIDIINIINKNGNCDIIIKYKNNNEEKLNISKSEIKEFYGLKIKDICEDLIIFFKDDNLYNYKLQKILITIKDYLIENLEIIIKQFFSGNIIMYIKKLVTGFLNSDKIKKYFINLILKFINSINENYCLNLLNDSIKKKIIISMLPIIITRGIDSVDNVHFLVNIIIKVIKKYLVNLKLEEVFQYKIFIIKFIKFISSTLGNLKIKNFIIS